MSLLAIRCRSHVNLDRATHKQATRTQVRSYRVHRACNYAVARWLLRLRASAPTRDSRVHSEKAALERNVGLCGSACTLIHQSSCQRTIVGRCSADKLYKRELRVAQQAIPERRSRPAAPSNAQAPCRHKRSARQREARQRSTCNQTKNMLHFSICACHRCARSMRIFSVSFQFQRMVTEGNPHLWNGDTANKKAEVNPRLVETERRVVPLRWRSAGGTPPRNARAPPAPKTNAMYTDVAPCARTHARTRHPWAKPKRCGANKQRNQARTSRLASRPAHPPAF